MWGLRYNQKMKKKNSGFTLIEIMVGMSVLAILVVAFSDVIGSTLRWQGRVKNTDRLANIQVALTTAYGQSLYESWVFRSGAAPNRFRFYDGSFAVTGTAVAGSLDAISQYGANYGTDLINDGYNIPLRIYVSNWLTITRAGGASIAYQEIAIVSLGENHILSPATVFNPTTGQLTLGGDDEGFTIGAAGINQNIYNQALLVTQHAATVLSTYFKGRYLNNVSRDVSIDYFANTNGAGVNTVSWDAGSPMPNTLSAGGWCGLLAANNAAVTSSLGLSNSEVSNPFSITSAPTLFLVNNQGAAGCPNFNLRYPDSTNVALQTPPYTAKLLMAMPGMVTWGDAFTLSTTVSGDF